jgi:hypothetical protein
VQRAGVFSGYAVHTWTTATWACSVAIQSAGTALIGWRAWATPTVVAARRTGKGRAVLWVLIDSGVLFSASTLLVLALAFVRPRAFDILTSALGQIAVRRRPPRSLLFLTQRWAAPLPQALVSLSIALREVWKAEHADDRQAPTHSLLVGRHDTATASLPHAESGVVVEVQTSRHEHADLGQVSSKAPSVPCRSAAWLTVTGGQLQLEKVVVNDGEGASVGGGDSLDFA